MNHYLLYFYLGELDAKYWETQAQTDLFKAYHRKLINKKAKNVIIFVGGGMGLSTITPARIYKGQNEKKTTGEEQQLVFEDFPDTCLIRVSTFSFQQMSDVIEQEHFFKPFTILHRPITWTFRYRTLRERQQLFYLVLRPTMVYMAPLPGSNDSLIVKCCKTILFTQFLILHLRQVGLNKLEIIN